MANNDSSKVTENMAVVIKKEVDEHLDQQPRVPVTSENSAGHTLIKNGVNFEIWVKQQTSKPDEQETIVRARGQIDQVHEHVEGLSRQDTDLLLVTQYFKESESCIKGIQNKTFRSADVDDVSNESVTCNGLQIEPVTNVEYKVTCTLLLKLGVEYMMKISPVGNDSSDVPVRNTHDPVIQEEQNCQNLRTVSNTDCQGDSVVSPSTEEDVKSEEFSVIYDWDGQSSSSSNLGDQEPQSSKLSQRNLEDETNAHHTGLLSPDRLTSHKSSTSNTASKQQVLSPPISRDLEAPSTSTGTQRNASAGGIQSRSVRQTRSSSRVRQTRLQQYCHYSGEGKQSKKTEEKCTSEDTSSKRQAQKDEEKKNAAQSGQCAVEKPDRSNAQHLETFHADISTTPTKDSPTPSKRKRNAASHTPSKRKKAEEVESGRKTNDSGVDSLRCRECAKEFAVPAFLAQHMKDFHGDISIIPSKNMPNKICQVRNRNSASIPDQKRKQAQQVNFGSNTNSKKACSSARTSHKRNNADKNPCVCDQCGKAFGHPDIVKRHKRIHTDEKPHVCDECGKAFRKRLNLKIHRRIHTGERPYVCDQCGKAFNQKSHLTSHKLVHTGEKPYVCDQCGKAFSQSGYLKVHKFLHTGERPYACDECGITFKNSVCLKEHKSIHTGVKPLVCDLCGKAFRHASTLTKHRHTHASKNFVCDQCGKAFCLSASLKTHILIIHTGEKPYVCDRCGKAFSYTYHLKKHMQEGLCV